MYLFSLEAHNICDRGITLLHVAELVQEDRAHSCVHSRIIIADEHDVFHDVVTHLNLLIRGPNVAMLPSAYFAVEVIVASRDISIVVVVVEG
jgi:hypothetical protein